MRRVHVTTVRDGKTYGIKIAVSPGLRGAAAKAVAQIEADEATLDWLLAHGAIVRCG